MSQNPSILLLVSTLVALLLIAAIVLAFSKRYKTPFTVALLIVGIIIANLRWILPPHLQVHLDYHISPDLIYYVCLPTLLFESAYGLDSRQLKRNLAPILTLAVPGLLISTFLIGFVVSALTSLPFLPSLLLGAILSATDPIAVIALFKQLGAPKRLTVLIEGESLFNDATSIVTAKLIMGVMLAGVFTAHHFWHGMSDFAFEFVGGVVVGWVTALIMGFILGKVKSDPEIEISLTTILAYGTFILAQNVFEVSGVMATVTAGLTLNSWGRAKVSPSVSKYLKQFWEFLAYIANALIFLLVGLSLNLVQIWNSFGILMAVILAMLLSRAVMIFGLMPIVSKIPGGIPISLRYQTAIYWGGLRGAIALAIALSLEPFGYNDLFIALVMGAVLFTLLSEGLSMEKLVHWLKLDQPPLADRLAKEEAELAAMHHSIAQIPKLSAGGFFSSRIAKEAEERCKTALKETQEQIDEIVKNELNPTEDARLIYLRGLAAEKKLYYDMFAKGHLSETAYSDLVDGLANQIDWLRYTHSPHEIQPAVIQHHDWSRQLMIKVCDTIPGLGFLSARLRSVRIALEYEELWGQHQGYIAVLNYLKQTIENQPKSKALIQQIESKFDQWQADLQPKIDAITEQFPEFVSGMQARLSQRLILQSEYDDIKHQAETGTLSEDIAKTLLSELADQIYKLRETQRQKVILDPTELLRKVPFFKNIPPDEYQEIIKLLTSRITLAGETIIKEGERGPSLYLIMRGVIRISKIIDGKDTDIATLMPGDFFGEMALIFDIPRTATCRTVTPCSLYELKRADFETLKEKYPAIKKAVEEVAKRRSEENQPGAPA